MSFRIERIWAFVSTENPGGDEGIVGMRVGMQWIPFVAADEARLRQLRDVAEEIANAKGLAVRLVRFDVRTDVDTIEPKRSTSKGSER